MKISYIIMPFASQEYLVRCIHAIQRQTRVDNEIILAQNRLDAEQDIEAYLGTVNGLRRISDVAQTDSEKLKEAVSLVEDEDTLVCFVDVDTVAVPIASQLAAESGKDLFGAAAAVKDGDAYRISFAGMPGQIDSGMLSPQKIFIRKSLLADMPDGMFTERAEFELWLNIHLLEGASVGVTEEICFYMQKDDRSEAEADADWFIHSRGRLWTLLRLMEDDTSREALTVYDRYLSQLCRLLYSDQVTVPQKRGLFELIRKFGTAAIGDAAKERFFELYLGVDRETLENMDIEAYLFYIRKIALLSDQKMVTACLKQTVADGTAPLQKNMAALETAVQAVKNEQGREAEERAKLAAEIRQIHNDAEALTKNMHFLRQSMESPQKEAVISDPVRQVPALFAEGRLGFKVILRSIKAWLGYKFGKRH